MLQFPSVSVIAHRKNWQVNLKMLLTAQVEDLEARLLLAGTETIQDRLRDCEAELKIVQEDLLNTRCRREN